MNDQVFIFDLDDTLFMERTYVQSGFEAVGEFVTREYGVEGTGRYAWELFQKGVRNTTFNNLIEHFALPEGALEALITTYRHHTPNIHLLEDAERFLNELNSSGARVGLVTDGYSVGQRQKIEALRLSKVLAPDLTIVTGEEGPGWPKPGPLAFEYIMEKADLPAGSLFYFGDNPSKDFCAPSHLGWNCIRVRRKDGLHYETPDQHPPTLTIPSFDAPELIQLLGVREQV